jgi:hypothetical protein
MRHIHTDTHRGLDERSAPVAGRHFVALTFFTAAVARRTYPLAQIPIDHRAD